MLELKLLRENKGFIVSGLEKRGWKPEDISVIDELLKLDSTKRTTQQKMDDAKGAANKFSAEIGKLFKSGDIESANKKMAEVATLKEGIKEAQTAFHQYEEQIEAILYKIPNIPHPSVPKGFSEKDNEILQEWNEPLPKLSAGSVPHWELGEKYGFLRFDLGVKLVGSGFPVFIGKGARMQRALIQYFLDKAVEAGYTEMSPPLLVNEETARGTGQLPDKEEQMYHVTTDNLYLIPTGEVPLTNVFRAEIFAESELPIKVCGYTPCFRREAGSYGKDVRGLNRVHQFDKVEIVNVATPEASYGVLDDMVKYVASLLTELDLPYRILRLCSGDLGFTAAITYDFEVFAAAQNKWLEVSSVSNFETFQSNRMKIRYRDADSKIHLTHTLNGSALALPRIMAAILENNQTENGIIVPDVLKKYMGFDLID